jgi:hypothetical protein
MSRATTASREGETASDSGGPYMMLRRKPGSSSGETVGVVGRPVVSKPRSIVSEASRPRAQGIS